MTAPSLVCTATRRVSQVQALEILDSRGHPTLQVNPKIIAEAIARGVGNAALIKVNQVGTVTEALEAMSGSRPRAGPPGQHPVIQPVARPVHEQHRLLVEHDDRAPDIKAAGHGDTPPAHPAGTRGARPRAIS
jgi:Enolase, C-terminal TIM barrel domain